MSRLVVRVYSISIDGYGAGPGQDLENPLGIGGRNCSSGLPHAHVEPHARQPGRRNWRRRRSGGAGFEEIGAWVMGRNMFGPVRGPWPDESWKGWWGDEPPYHTPVFVLTHHARQPLQMQGGTEFFFVTGGIQAALEQARAAAGGKDIRIGGGAATIRQYLNAGLIDELHLVISPALLGSGEHLLHGIDTRALGYECVKHVGGSRAVAHVFLSHKSHA